MISCAQQSGECSWSWISLKLCVEGKVVAGNLDQYILGYKSIFSSFQLDVSLSLCNYTATVNTPLPSPGGSSSESHKTTEQWLAKITMRTCDCERLSQMFIDWIEVLAQVQHDREQSNNTKMCVCLFVRETQVVRKVRFKWKSTFSKAIKNSLSAEMETQLSS